jgi:hypothetical protein
LAVWNRPNPRARNIGRRKAFRCFVGIAESVVQLAIRSEAVSSGSTTVACETISK